MVNGSYFSDRLYFIDNFVHVYAPKDIIALLHQILWCICSQVYVIIIKQLCSLVNLWSHQLFNMVHNSSNLVHSLHHRHYIHSRTALVPALE